MLVLLFAIFIQTPTELPQASAEKVKRFCSVQWPDNFRMQAYCMEQQVAGMRETLAIRDKYGVALSKAQAACVLEWTKDGLTDWNMVGYCSRQQAAGYEAMRR